jgi:hypothetical protein
MVHASQNSRRRCTALASMMLGLLLATATHAQFPTTRILPEAPIASQRVYLELGIAPCQVYSRDVISHGADIRIVQVVTMPCQPTLPTKGNTVVDMGLFPEGGARVGVSVDDVHRVVNFSVGTANPDFIDDDTPIVGSDRRADHSLEVMGGCGFDVVTLANDSRTEIIVDRRPAPRPCPISPPIVPVPIGFPTPGEHLVILEIGGVVAKTQLITVANGFDKLDYSDLWWNASEPGWGLTILQHDKDRLFAVLYGYRQDGRPLWLSMSGGDWDSGTRVSGAFNVSRGTPQTGPFDPSHGSQSTVARGTLEFTSPDTATFTLQATTTDFPGLAIPALRTWALRRVPF